MKRILSWTAAGALGVALLFVGGMALAAGGDDPADACYHNHTGALRIDVDGTGCRSNETAVSLGGSHLTTRTVVTSGSLPHPGFAGEAAECAEGEVVLGGGMEVESINPDIGITTSAPLTDGRQGWQVSLHSDVSSGDPTTFFVFAVCAPGTAG